LRAAGLRFALVRDHAEVVADPASWANGYFAKAVDNGTEHTLVTSPVRFSTTPARFSAMVAELGQHTEEVLLELGYSWDDIGQLRDEGVI